MAPQATPSDPRGAFAALIARWKEDPGGTYRSWFLWDQRLKNFRSIRAIAPGRSLAGGLRAGFLSARIRSCFEI